jgi:hypothetical protein
VYVHTDSQFPSLRGVNEGLGKHTSNRKVNVHDSYTSGTEIKLKLLQDVTKMCFYSNEYTEILLEYLK